MPGTYFFEGRKLDFLFVTVFHLFPSNFVPILYRLPEDPQTQFCCSILLIWVQLRFLESWVKKISGFPAFAGVQSPDVAMHLYKPA